MPTRVPLIAGNWKMHNTAAETAALLSELVPRLAGALTDREAAVAPPFTALETAARVLKDTPIGLAAQNLHHEAHGAFTGEISGPMLAAAGCRYVIVGHSERRQYCGETDRDVAAKIRAARREGLAAIVCVGESLAERERGDTLAVVSRQIRGALDGQPPADVAGLVIAYEPVWAIGTGRTASPQQAQDVHAAIRATLAELGGRSSADAVRILYGGSVKPDTVDGLMAQPDIDGVLVGGASLQAASFARIVRFA